MPRFNLSQPTFEYDPEDPEGFRAGMFRLGPDMGAELTGTTLYELPRGRSDETARVLMWSNVVWPTGTAYLDSDKAGLWLAPGDSLMVEARPEWTTTAARPLRPAFMKMNRK